MRCRPRSARSPAASRATRGRRGATRPARRPVEAPGGSCGDLVAPRRRPSRETIDRSQERGPAHRLRRTPPDLLLRVRGEPGLPEELEVLAHVGAGGVEAADVVPRALLDQGAEQGPADLGGHRSSAASSSVMAQSSRCGSSMARQLPTISPSDSATRWTDGARSGSHDGMSVERLIAASRSRGPARRGCGGARQRRRARDGRDRPGPADRSVARRRIVRSVSITRSTRTLRHQLEQEPMHSPVGVSSGWKVVASTLPCRIADRPAVGVAGQHLGARAQRPSTIGARMKTPWSDALAEGRDVELGLETNRAGGRSRCAGPRCRASRSTGVVAVARCARPAGSCRRRCRASAPRRGPSRRSARAARSVDEAAHGGRFAAGQDERVEVDEVARQAHLDRLGADLANGVDVGADGALHREDADPWTARSLLHRSTSRERRGAPRAGSLPS